MTSALIYYPNSQADLFKTGGHKYGIDYTRENATNGVALAVNGLGQTYSNNILGMPSTVPAAAESNSHFQILSFKQMSDDQYTTQYVLEAKSDATLFDNNEAAKQLSNGYIRMNIAISHL